MDLCQRTRRIAPFSFGRDTGWNECWIRTAPQEQIPGLFTTHRGWLDPFTLLQSEDSSGEKIASVLSQEGIRPCYSGALIVGASGDTIIEGRAGTGDALMLGELTPQELPPAIIGDVRSLNAEAAGTLGPVRFEWVHDGEAAWIVQLHRGATESSSQSLTPGDANNWVEFRVDSGLAALRKVLAKLPQNTGLLLKGRVGLTSHVADVIRKAKVPSRMTG